MSSKRPELGDMLIKLALLTYPWVEMSNTRRFFTATTS
jgi:hypothetical protein